VIRALLFLLAAVGAYGQQVALTFDDLPAHGAIPPGATRVTIAKDVIRALRAAKAPRVWGFINAQKLDQDPALAQVLKLWIDAGFPLGNHTYSHKDLHATSIEEFKKDVAGNETVLRSLMGEEDWRWFRYPFLREGNTIEKRHALIAYLRQQGYQVAQTTLDFEDYAWNAPYARCLARNDLASIEWLKSSYLSTASEFIELGRKMALQLYGREIRHVMLLHLGGFQGVMLPKLIELLRERGFQLITLEEAQKDAAYQSDPDAPSKYGGTLLEQLMAARRLPVPPHVDKPFARLEAICR
jgi:peptidoglycan/xylan/chitin deacetylase (PgdA/CDA1 family)